MAKQTLQLLLILTAALSSVSHAQVPDLDLRRLWDMDADSISYDGKTLTTVFSRPRFSQGGISIEADEGRTTTSENKAGVWDFSGNVIIDVQNGRIECEQAVLNFAKNELRTAKVTGSPATFRLQRTGADDATVASAGKLLYDVKDGVIEFSDDASITEGGNQISSEFLIYDISEQRISADSNGDANGRVRITYTPDDDATTAEQADETNQ